MYTLSRRAQYDRLKLLEDLSTDDHAGLAVARHVNDILEDYLRRIASGLVPGHSRLDIRSRRPLLFCNAKPTKYVIAFDPSTREIVRIIHGHRELTRLFGQP